MPARLECGAIPRTKARGHFGFRDVQLSALTRWTGLLSAVASRGVEDSLDRVVEPALVSSHYNQSRSRSTLWVPNPHRSCCACAWRSTALRRRSTRRSSGRGSRCLSREFSSSRLRRSIRRSVASVVFVCHRLRFIKTSRWHFRTVAPLPHGQG